MRYNACTMATNDLQITIRGLSPETKQALVKKAAQHGLSLNRYALQSLKQGAGVTTNEERYQAMKHFLSQHSMTKEDKQALDDAIAWSKKSSLAKQKQDEANGLSF